ncbi:metalloendopeptidase OMA1, mitochondrial-like [Watersipora subatra]|uniref:metalloendopeptidase OMA1, mitochondrial-like n=1 Tax=Watersipora subatra TaxID=2589382 RepID=UPI00355C85F6
MSRLAWLHVRQIFWFNFNKPHRKLKLVTQGKLNHVSHKYARKVHVSHSKKPSQGLLLATARRSLSQPLVSASATRVFESVGHRSFHISLPRNAAPAFWLVFKPISKLWAMLWGRYIRRWWAKVPQDQKNQYLKLLGGMKGIIIGVIVVLTAGTLINYYIHLDENPLTGRTRFMSLTHDQILVVADQEEKGILDEVQVISASDPRYQVVSECSMRILKANQANCDQIWKLDWSVTVVDDDSTSNAFVLPNGHIFVYTGLIKEMRNVDQLAVVLSHEIAHAVMGHSIEHISRGQLLDFVAIAVLAAIWTVVPGDGIALVTQWFYNKLIKLMLDLPYSRELETEADTVGLGFAAKACYDVREAPAFWALQEALLKYSPGIGIPEFMSTHPSHESRVRQLQDVIPEALKLRQACSCQPLSSADPVQRVQKEIELLREKHENSKSKNDTPAVAS